MSLSESAMVSLTELGRLRDMEERAREVASPRVEFFDVNGIDPKAVTVNARDARKVARYILTGEIPRR